MNIDFSNIKTIHFTGIKGVGMTAAALYCQDRGIQVGGSDVADEFVTDATLSKRGIVPLVGFTPQNIPSDTDLVIYTGAHGGPNNPEVVAARERGIPVSSLGAAMQILQADKQVVSICGVGGKTSTSAMLAVIMTHANKEPSYMVGVASIVGVPYPGKYNASSNTLILEADEYATAPGVDNTPRFMHQNPHIIACTNIAHDHPDIYPTLESTKKAYLDFFQKLPNDDTLVINSDNQNTAEITTDLQVEIISVGFAPESTYLISDIQVVNQKQKITFIYQGESRSISLKVPGKFNAKNALMAYAIASKLGLDHQEIEDGLREFGGTNRRFEYKGIVGQTILYDDYAHHPEEIKATLQAAREWFPSKKIQVVFQPHTYSRTKALFQEFATSFSDADEVIISTIFPSAREEVDASVSGELLAEEVKNHHTNSHFISRKDLVKYFLNQPVKPDVFITMGAGDVYEIHQAIKDENAQ